jgi:hypothetical protein
MFFQPYVIWHYITLAVDTALQSNSDNNYIWPFIHYYRTAIFQTLSSYVVTEKLN